MPSSKSNTRGVPNNNGAKSSTMTKSDASRVQSSQVSLAHDMLDIAMLLIWLRRADRRTRLLVVSQRVLRALATGTGTRLEAVASRTTSIEVTPQCSILERDSCVSYQIHYIVTQ